MSQNILGNIVKVYITTTEEPFRIETSELEVDPLGVIGDKFYGKDPTRAILVTSLDAYKIASELEISLDNGLLGENILIEGSIKSLQLGESFFIGNMEFELAQNCTLCKGLSKIDTHLPKLLKDDRGIFIRAKSSGRITRGDTISTR